MSAFTVLFLTFFVCALLLLTAMVLMVFPAMLQSVTRVIRTFRARRNREFRINACSEASEEELCQVEDVYYFETDSIRK